MNSYILFLVLLCVALAVSLPQDWPNKYNNYKRYKVYEVLPKSRDQVNLLRKWMLEEPLFDFWKEPTKNLEPVHIMVNNKQEVRLVTNLRKHGIQFTIYKHHMDRQIEEFVTKEETRRNKKEKAFDINDFNTLDDIMDWLAGDLLVQCADAGISCQYVEAHYSVEQRAIPRIIMSSGGINVTKPVYLIDATIHAREWLAPATILKIMDHVSRGNGGALLDNNDIVFMPMINPDGYEYSWTNERYWRKNRKVVDDCVGVDLNRNADYMWGLEGVSMDPCSNTYCGPSGNSEPEMQAIDEVQAMYADRQRAYITFHSYGYMWMHSWGNTVDNEGEVCERTEDHDDLFAVAEATANAIEATHNTNWARGNGCEVIYETTGATDDYAKAVNGWKYAFTPELRGNDFVVSADEIIPSFEEIWNGLEAKEAAIAANPPPMSIKNA